MYFDVGDDIDTLKTAYERFTSSTAEEVADEFRFDVPVTLHAGGAWHVIFTMTGDSISSGLEVRIEHRLAPPPPDRPSSSSAAIASANGWSEDGPEATRPGAFCGATWFFLSTER